MTDISFIKKQHTIVAPVAFATWRISSFLTRLTAIAPAPTKYWSEKNIKVIKESANRKEERGSSKIQLKRCKSKRLNSAKIINNYRIIWKCTKSNTWKAVFLYQELMPNSVASHGFTEKCSKSFMVVISRCQISKIIEAYVSNSHLCPQLNGKIWEQASWQVFSIVGRQSHQKSPYK